MRTSEAWEALKNRRPVILTMPGGQEFEYKRVSAVIVRVDDNDELDHSVELEDVCGHSVTIAGPKSIRYK